MRVLKAEDRVHEDAGAVEDAVLRAQRLEAVLPPRLGVLQFLRRGQRRKGGGGRGEEDWEEGARNDERMSVWGTLMKGWQKKDL